MSGALTAAGAAAEAQLLSCVLAAAACQLGQNMLHYMAAAEPAAMAAIVWRCRLAAASPVWPVP
jgi:hypothetical protein